MSLNDLVDSLDVEKPGVEKYSRNNNFFRTQFSPGDFVELPRRTFASFANEQDFRQYHCLYPRIVFIDLGDIKRYLSIENKPGFSAIDVMKIAGITCTFIGDETVLTDVLWSSFEEEIVSTIMAELGIDYEGSALGEPFNEAIGVVFEISNLVARYLVHANYPLVEGESIYGPAEYKNGIVALMLKEYSALAVDYHRRENEFWES